MRGWVAVIRRHGVLETREQQQDGLIRVVSCLVVWIFSVELSFSRGQLHGGCCSVGRTSEISDTDRNGTSVVAYRG